MAIRRTMEDYLKIIYLENQKTGCGVKSVTIAEKMNVSRPTVSTVTKQLVADGYATRNNIHELFLTDKGRAVAEGIFERHRVISVLLEGLGVSPDTAHYDACRMEHNISDESLAAFKRALERKEKADRNKD